jgi:hypothetical protein
VADSAYVAFRAGYITNSRSNKILKDISQKWTAPRRFRVLEESFGERRERGRILREDGHI